MKNKTDMGKVDYSSCNKHVAAHMANTVSQTGRLMNFMCEDWGGTNTALESESDNQGFYCICFIYCMQVSIFTLRKLIRLISKRMLILERLRNLIGGEF